MVVILAETDGEEVWVWCGQSVIIDDEYILTIQQTWDATTTRQQSAINDGRQAQNPSQGKSLI